MLATCVKMHVIIPRFSLARMRFEDPQPPFWVGGEYVQIDRQPYLRDALHIHALTGPKDLLSPLKNGDLALILVRAVDAGALCFERAEKLQTAHKERPRAKIESERFSRFVDQVRSFLKARGLSEFFTSSLVTCPGLEPTLEPFATTMNIGERTQTVYLPTSPEIQLKKVMAHGWTDLFEIRPCFRSGEISEHHSPEFTMLEWYRGFADLDLVIEDLAALLEALKPWMQKPQSPRVTDFAALFQETLDFKLTPKTETGALRDLALGLRMDIHPSDTFTDLFHRLLIEKIEPAMVSMGPLIVRRFPPAMAALARLDSQGWADRLEFYWNGLEIANAFNEVTDPLEQRKRWDGEQHERRRLGTTELPQDPELIEALQMGLPPTGGIALGLERLYMACTGVRNITELKVL